MEIAAEIAKALKINFPMISPELRYEIVRELSARMDKLSGMESDETLRIKKYLSKLPKAMQSAEKDK